MHYITSNISLATPPNPAPRYDLPRITALLSLPEFDALQRFLAHAQVDIGQLQEAVDQMVAGIV